jgi:hypothetical protein
MFTELTHRMPTGGEDESIMPWDSLLSNLSLEDEYQRVEPALIMCTGGADESFYVDESIDLDTEGLDWNSMLFKTDVLDTLPVNSVDTAFAHTTRCLEACTVTAKRSKERRSDDATMRHKLQSKTAPISDLPRLNTTVGNDHAVGIPVDGPVVYSVIGRNSKRLSATRRPHAQNFITCSDEQMHEKLESLFHLGRTEVCKIVGISSTKFKQRCRDLGISRWPARKLQSIRIHHAALNQMMGAAAADAQAEDAELIVAHIRDLDLLTQKIYEFPDHPIPSFIWQMAELKRVLKGNNREKRRRGD